MTTRPPTKCSNNLCRASFRPKTKTSKFCCSKCRTQSSTVKRATTRVKTFPSSAFGKWLIWSCARAGTVEVLRGVDVEALYGVWKQCRQYNGYGHNADKSRLYQISHICPIAGHHSLGLLHPDNLVITPTLYNQQRGTGWNGVSGKFLNRTSINPSMRIDRGDTSEIVISKIGKLLGVSFGEFLMSHQLALTGKASMVGKLKAAGCKADIDEDSDYERLVGLMKIHFPDDGDGDSSGYRRLGLLDEELVFRFECLRLGAEYHAEISWDYLHNEFPIWVENTSYPAGYVVNSSVEVVCNDGEVVVFNLN